MTRPLVLIDAENVRRSRWPNLSRGELVERCRAWGAQENFSLELVFDGRAPEAKESPALALAGSGAEKADELIVRRAEELRSAGVPFWLVTSDRELRELAGAGAERVLGGGAFVRGLGVG